MNPERFSAASGTIGANVTIGENVGTNGTIGSPNGTIGKPNGVNSNIIINTTNILFIVTTVVFVPGSLLRSTKECQLGHLMGVPGYLLISQSFGTPRGKFC